jgi:hypothetical protein
MRSVVPNCLSFIQGEYSLFVEEFVPEESASEELIFSSMLESLKC